MSTEGNMFSIRVPASTANLGPGFDSVGLALGLYLHLDAERSQQWEVIALTDELKQFPSDEQNYIVKVAQKTAAYYGKQLEPHVLYVSSDIPLARGLGSSASAIVAGIELADAACGLGLTIQEKAHHASLIEGHPDNAGASVLGGLVVGKHTEEHTDILSFMLEEVKVIAVIPDYELLTEKSRDVLPADVTFGEAVRASAVSNMLVAALLSKNWQLAGKMMKEDRFHQPYRTALIPHFPEIEKAAEQSGAFGVAISGAGPTVVCFTESESAVQVCEQLSSAFPQFAVKIVDIDYQGSVVTRHKDGHGEERTVNARGLAE
ncbi:homoserine kinase [Peribacillus saganii]|uniref:Homoserine kinase n=1 Tax=Peribacillus saganii TaxID=2303992 RepID=A0A372LR15_9BACI|nr:homoserine kinase [Peribacillus saganii]RFU70113.1 homoserine kinase [Peribacillus saganii]